MGYFDRLQAKKYADKQDQKIINGEVPINMPAGSISENELQDGILPNKFYGINSSINIFDKRRVLTGGYYSYTTGKWAVNNSFASTHFIPVSPNEVYTSSKGGNVVFWDVEKQHVSGFNTSTTPSTFTVPNDSRIEFMTISMTSGSEENYMVAKGDTLPDSYQPYYYTLDGEIFYSPENEQQRKDINNLQAQMQRTQSVGSHWLETKTAPSMYKNATTPLNMTTYDGGSEAIHAVVEYIPEGFGGYRYWMASTPYTDFNESVENPSIYCSYDGIDWQEPASGINPIAPKPSGNAHNSDTFLLYRKDIKQLEVWWRKRVREDTTNNIPQYEVIERKTTTDGTNWSATEELFRIDGSAGDALSPSVYYNEEKGIYECWLIKSNATNTTAFDSLKFYETDSNGKNWTLVNEWEPTFQDGRTGWRIWHGGVFSFSDGYELIVTATNGDNNNNMELFYSTSTDGKVFEPLTLVMTPQEEATDSVNIYHASLVKSENEHVIYYSARRSDLKWTLNRSVLKVSKIMNKMLRELAL